MHHELLFISHLFADATGRDNENDLEKAKSQASVDSVLHVVLDGLNQYGLASFLIDFGHASSLATVFRLGLAA